jgi:hypothetical protein
LNFRISTPGRRNGPARGCLAQHPSTNTSIVIDSDEQCNAGHWPQEKDSRSHVGYDGQDEGPVFHSFASSRYCLRGSSLGGGIVWLRDENVRWAIKELGKSSLML